MEKMKSVFLTNSYFSLCDKREIDTNRFFKDSSKLANFKNKILDKFDDHPFIYSTGNIYRHFRNFKRVNRSEDGRVANEFNIILEHKGVNHYMPSGNGCFLEWANSSFEKDFSTKYFDFIKSYKR